MASPQGLGDARLLSRRLERRERKALGLGGSIIGVLSGVAQFVTADNMRQRLELLAISAGVVVVGIVLTLCAIRLWRTGRREVKLQLNVVVLAVVTIVVLGVVGGLAGRGLGISARGKSAVGASLAAKPSDTHGTTGGIPETSNLTSRSDASDMAHFTPGPSPTPSRREMRIYSPAGSSLPRSNPNVDSYDVGFDPATEHAFLALTNTKPGSKWFLHSCYRNGDNVECPSIPFGNNESTTGTWTVVAFVVDQKGCMALTSSPCAGPIATLQYSNDPSWMVGDDLRARSDDYHFHRS